MTNVMTWLCIGALAELLLLLEIAPTGKQNQRHAAGVGTLVAMP